MTISNNILSDKSKGIQSVLLDLASRVKTRRLEKNWSQAEIAKRSGMSLASYRRFEQSGEIALKSLVKISFLFNDVAELENLFTRKQYLGIDEVLNEKKAKTRKRAGKK